MNPVPVQGTMKQNPFPGAPMRLCSTVFCLALSAASLFGQSVPAKPKVRLTTTYGPILIELEPEAAPKTVENFLAYVKEGHYSGTIFHRVIPSFMIQGGGLAENMTEKPTRAPIPNEAEQAAKAGLLNTRGMVAMARTGEPHSAAAQFFINTADNPRLDFQSATAEGYGYCVFGRVTEGMEVVARIEKVITVARRGMLNVPEYPVRIQSAELVPAN